MPKLTPQLRKQFNLEDRWKHYLQLIGLDESTLPEVQRAEMKRTFFGAIGQFILLQRDEMSLLDEDTGVEVFQHLMDQVGIFFLHESSRQN